MCIYIWMHACMHNTDAEGVGLIYFTCRILNRLFSAMIGFAVLLASFTVFGAGLRCFYGLLTVFSQAGALF